MSTPRYHVLAGSVVISFPGRQPVTFIQGTEIYKNLINAIRSGADHLISGIIQGTAKCEEKISSNAGVEYKNGGVYVDNVPVPTVLAEKFVQYREMGIPNDSLILFWNKLRQNPSERSVQMLFKFLEHNGHPITRDGNFIAYRKVKRNSSGRLVDCHTGTMPNDPGCRPEMDRDQVDSNPDQTCSRGLHVAAWAYLKSFGGDTIIEVEVDPRDVVAVPIDYNGTKMRVSAFRVLSQIKAPREDEILVETAKELPTGAVELKGTKATKEAAEKSKAEVKAQEYVPAVADELKSRFKVKSKTGSFVKELQFWTSNADPSSGTLTITTAKGVWRFWSVGIVTANNFLNSKDQDKFYREKIKTTFESSKI